MIAQSAPPGVGIMGLSHTGVTVSDMEASLAFYRDGLGLPVEFDAVRDADYLRETLALPFSDIRFVRLSIPGAPGSFVELLEFRGVEREPAAARPCDPASGHLCLFVRDTQAAHDQMVGLGYRSRSSSAVTIDSGISAGARILFLADPDGSWVELLEPAPVAEGLA